MWKKIYPRITPDQMFHAISSAVFDGIGDGISVIDRDYNIIRVNKGILKIFKRSGFSELIGSKCYTEYYQRDHACDNCPALRTFTEGHTRPHNKHTAARRGKDGSRYLHLPNKRRQ